MINQTSKHEWRNVRFGDVVKLNTNRISDPEAEGIERYVGLEHITPEDLIIRDWGFVSEGTTFTNHFKPGQVLFGKRRAYQRKVALADFEGVCSSDIYTFETKDADILLPEFLPFLCQSEGFYNFAVNTSAGSLSPRTNWKHLKEYGFALPPLDEQRRIIEILKSIENNISRYDFLYKSIYVLRKSIENHYLEKNDNSPFVSIKEVAEINPESTKAIKEYDNINYIDISSVSEQSGVLEDEIKSYKYKDAPSRARRVVRSGDIIISTVRIYLKTYALIGEIHDGNVVSTGFCVLRPNKNLILPELLFALIKSEKFIGLMDAYSTGTNYPSVSIDDIAAYNIPLLPLNKQMEIIKIFSSLSLAEKSIHSRKCRLTVFKKIVLDSL